MHRPVEDQERELRSTQMDIPKTLEVPPQVPKERYGEGLVTATEGSDRSVVAHDHHMWPFTVFLSLTPSDDDLVPYVMGDDPDPSQPHPPRYLRTLLQGQLVNTNTCTMHS